MIRFDVTILLEHFEGRGVILSEFFFTRGCFSLLRDDVYILFFCFRANGYDLRYVLDLLLWRIVYRKALDRRWNEGLTFNGYVCPMRLCMSFYSVVSHSNKWAVSRYERFYFWVLRKNFRATSKIFHKLLKSVRGKFCNAASFFNFFFNNFHRKKYTFTFTKKKQSTRHICQISLRVYSTVIEWSSYSISKLFSQESTVQSNGHYKKSTQAVLFLQ